MATAMWLANHSPIDGLDSLSCNVQSCIKSIFSKTWFFRRLSGVSPLLFLFWQPCRGPASTVRVCALGQSWAVNLEARQWTSSFMLISQCICLGLNFWHSLTDCCRLNYRFFYCIILLVSMQPINTDSKRHHMGWRRTPQLIDEAYEKGFGLNMAYIRTKFDVRREKNCDIKERG